MSERIVSTRRSVSDAATTLGDDVLEAVAGGTEGFPGLPLGTRINVSPWGSGAFNRQWDLVGATGHLPN